MPDEEGAYARSNGLQLWYRDEGDSSGEPLLLIMGLNSQLILWPQQLVDALGGNGYRVIRFDNRDCGLSDKIGGTVPPPSALQPAYLLKDMADDTAGLLDVLGIEQAHVVGASMGGMIAQLLAINHPAKVRSLCSIMSTTGAPFVGYADPKAIAALLEPTPEDPEEAVAHIAGIYAIIGSQTLAEEEAENRLAFARASYQRAFYPAGARRQLAAINAAANRTAQLRNLDVRTAVIHGAEDSLIHISGGRATADAIPDATFLEMPTMGHDLPQSLLERIAEEIVTNARAASK